MRDSTIAVDRLMPRSVAEVHGVDLGQPLDPRRARAIHDALTVSDRVTVETDLELCDYCSGLIEPGQETVRLIPVTGDIDINFHYPTCWDAAVVE